MRGVVAWSSKGKAEIAITMPQLDEAGSLGNSIALMDSYETNALTSGLK